MPLDRHATMQIQHAGRAVSLCCYYRAATNMGNVIFLFNNQCASRISISPLYEIEYLPLSRNSCPEIIAHYFQSPVESIIIYKCLQIHAFYKGLFR